MKITIAAAVFATLFTASCRSKPHDHVIIQQQPASQPSTVVIEKEHVHGATCGHYYYNGVWYAEPEHVHVIEIK